MRISFQGLGVLLPLCFRVSFSGSRFGVSFQGSGFPSPFSVQVSFSGLGFGVSFEGLGRAGGGGGWGGRSPPHLQTQCSHHGFGRDWYALKQNLPAKKQEPGGWGRGGHPLCKRNSCNTGLEGTRMLGSRPARLKTKKKSGGVGGGPPPVCKRNARSLGLELVCFEASLGGCTPPICKRNAHSLGLELVCFV